MEKMIDLSGTLENGLWGYHELPGLENKVPRVEVTPVATVEKDGFFASKVVLSTISGTYLEAGSHVLENGKTLDQYPPERFMVDARLIRLPPQAEKSLIGASLLEQYAQDSVPGDALLIDTGWGKRWNTPGYVLSCPNFTSDALRWILQQKISLLGVDVPCIEASWSEDDEGEKGGLLGELFRQDALLLAPLVRLDEISGSSGMLVCLPISIKGTSGAPCRAVFIENHS